MKQFLIGAALAIVPVSAAAVFYVHWSSEEQQLKRACWGVAESGFVSPSTVDIVDSEIFRHGRFSVAATQLEADIKLMEIALAEKSARREKALATMTSASHVTIENAGAARYLQLLSDSADLARLKLQLDRQIEEESASLEVLRQRRSAHDADAVGEIWLIVDAQNKLGVPLRGGRTVCTFRDQGAPESVTSVKLHEVTNG